LTGAGQNLGLLEFYGTNLSDLTTYYNNVHQTNTVPITLLSVDGTSTSCNYPACDDGEQNLDITQALGMAPGLASLTMYIGSTDTAIISAMTTHNPLPATIGCSWGWTPVDPSSLDPYFQKMAAQGQNFFVASGDSATWKTGNYPWPAEDGNVVTVGGTDLTTSSAGGPWASETAWVDSGGGISPHHIAIPSYQQQPWFHDLPQWAGRVCQRELHLLYLRRSAGLPGQQLRWNQFRRAHVGGLYRPREPATGGQRTIDPRVPQPDHLQPEHHLQLRHQFPRHHQRIGRQLFNDHRV
jgi:hypothetical protein